MKKSIVLFFAFQMILFFNSCSSDSGDKPTPEPELKVADYVVNIESRGNFYAGDFVVNNDNTVFFTGSVNGWPHLKKIDPTGKWTLVKMLNGSFTALGFGNTVSDDIVFFNYSSDYGNILYRFENNYQAFSPFYTMKPNGPFGGAVRLTSFCNAHTANSNSFFVFDYGIKSIKRIVIGDVNTDFKIAGSEKEEIKDGVGLGASFYDVDQMIWKNNILYMIDRNFGNLYTIRKMELTDKGWQVTTLISTTTDTYQNIGIDSQNNLYVLVTNKGIYKLDIVTNTLSVYKDGVLVISNKDRNNYDFPKDINFKELDFMYIKNDDLYISHDYRIIKISNFRTKL
jgi:hypothetical protein